MSAKNVVFEDLRPFHITNIMSTNRRDFLKQTMLAGAVVALKPFHLFAKSGIMTMNDMQFRFYPYTLELKHVFTVAVNSRTTTAVMMVEVEKDGIIGYGEASMPPYLGESHETAKTFLSKKVTWTSPAGKAISGQITNMHGNKGAMRVQFEKGMPGQAIGQKANVE